MSTPTLDVLIVGAGPVGLTLAAFLHRHGVSQVRIIDRAPRPTDTSRALVIWPRSLELLDKVGLAAALTERGRPLHGANIFADGARLLHVSFDHIQSPYKAALSIPQSTTEQVLGAHLDTVGRAVERPVALVSFTADATGVDCLLRHGDGGEERVRARWLVGCDGAHSTVRHILQQPFEGHTLTSTWVLADVDVAGDVIDDEMSIFWHSEGVVAVFPMGDGRVRIIIDQPPGTRTDAPPTLEAVQATVDARVGRGWRLSNASWLSTFTINERKVRDYARGRVFLAGDAAHIHSPAGGQGMNTGMQDAVNLAWKLALVLRDQAPASLLDSYSVERGRVGETVVHNADALTTLATIRGPVKQHVRNQMVRFLGHFGFVHDKMTDMLTELSICYPTSPIVSEHGSRLAWTVSRGVEPGYRVPDARLRDAASGEMTTLFGALAGTRHVMLLFMGLHADEHEVAALFGAARSVAAKYAAQIEMLLVALEPVDEWDGRQLLDEDASAHRVFGAGHASVYVVRPDGYVGFRVQPVDGDALQAWLETVFTPA